MDVLAGIGDPRRPGRTLLVGSLFTALLVAAIPTGTAYATSTSAESAHLELSAVTEGNLQTVKCLGKGRTCSGPQGGSCGEYGCSSEGPPAEKRSPKHRLASPWWRASPS